MPLLIFLLVSLQHRDRSKSRSWPLLYTFLVNHYFTCMISLFFFSSINSSNNHTAVWLSVQVAKSLSYCRHTTCFWKKAPSPLYQWQITTTTTTTTTIITNLERVQVEGVVGCMQAPLCFGLGLAGNIIEKHKHYLKHLCKRWRYKYTSYHRS